MARDNYSHKKYLRELAKKKKAEEKKQRKLEKKNTQVQGQPVPSNDENAAPAANPEPTLDQGVRGQSVI